MNSDQEKAPVPDPSSPGVLGARDPRAPGGARGGRCARCGTPLPAQVGPGRKRTYCTRSCADEQHSATRRRRREDSRQRTATVRVEASRGQLPPLSAKFVEASRRLGLSQADIIRKMAAEDGLQIRASVLSNWFRGRLPRDGSDPRLAAVARILQIPRKELLSLLAPPRATPVPSGTPGGPDEEAMRRLRELTSRLGGTHRYVTTAVEDRLFVGKDRKPYRREVAQTIVAVRDYCDCVWLYYSPDGEGITTRVEPCRPLRRGRHVRWQTGRRGTGIEAMELLTDRILMRGESLTIRYTVWEEHVAAPSPIHRRATSAPSGAGEPPFDRLSMSVEFEVPPRQVWSAEWDQRGTSPKALQPAPLEGTLAELTLADPAPSLYGLLWRW